MGNNATQIQERFAELSRVLSVAGEAFGKPINPDMVRFYSVTLNNFSISEIAHAILEHAADPIRGKFWPKPADIIFAISKRSAKVDFFDKLKLVFPSFGHESAVDNQQMREMWLELLRERFEEEPRAELLLEAANRCAESLSYNPTYKDFCEHYRAARIESNRREEDERRKRLDEETKNAPRITHDVIDFELVEMKKSHPDLSIGFLALKRAKRNMVSSAMQKPCQNQKMNHQGAAQIGGLVRLDGFVEKAP